ncbi:MAG TPA: FlgD immunoglobulin-like domain containing protein [Spirochaetia bacterium]|nr:FlgD immunoglobulin-like domain containing protein [Spirochaetia bacterium]
MKTFRPAFPAILFAALAVLSAPAYDPPRGGEYAQLLTSPFLLAGGSWAASTESPASDYLNPAASAGQQRVVLDANYAAVVGMDAQTGWGSALNLGLTIPKPYGVWTASAQFLSIPDSLTSLPLGTAFRVEGSIAKDLYPNLYAGIGAGLVIGDDWGLAADLGILRKVGDFLFFKNFQWGAVLSGLGKPYVPAGLGAAGGAATAFPGPYTLTLGGRGDFIQTEKFRAGASLDLAAPSFQNLLVNAGLEGSFREKVILRLGWGLNVHEILNSPAALLPSLGLFGKFELNRKSDESFISKQGWDRSEIRPGLAVKPLYDGIYAYSAGINIPLGVVDREAPVVQLTYPETPWGAYYLSPNSDGKNDQIELPLSIKERRYLSGYTMTVYRGDPAPAGSAAPASPEAAPAVPAEGSAVRVIGNKESRPETSGLAGFRDRLAYVKKGIPVPDKLVWNGFADDGKPVPDGRYTIVVEAVDDNGNKGTSKVHEVFVDSTPPRVEIAAPRDAVDLIFSPDGDGGKDTLTIRKTGSQEDLWTARVLDASGASVKTVEYKASAPADLTWDGRNDAGTVVPDGVYSFVVESTDRAGNTVSRRLDNIVVNTQQPPITVAIDVSAFSPNGDGVRDTVALLPGVPIRTGLASWRLAVLDEGRTERWSRTGSDAASLPERWAFDGKDAAGKPLPEGSYRAFLEVRYVNGYAPSATSPLFLLDVTPPSARASVERPTFNPAGAAGQNAAALSASGSRELAWTAEVTDAAGKAVRTWSFPGEPDARIEWDGRDESGKIVPDGAYAFRLRSVDRAGNSGSSAPVNLRVDTEKKAAVVSSDARAFSPNGDGVKDSVRIVPEVRSSDAPASWDVVVKSSAGGAAVRSWKGTGAVPRELVWNGRNDGGTQAPDGSYEAELTVRFANLDTAVATSGVIILDTVAPKAQVSAAPLLFSPNGDGRKDEVVITQSAAPGDDWRGSILAANGRPVRTWTWRGALVPVSWDGRDDEGNPASDGRYSYVLSSEDAAGNKAEYRIDGIAADTRAVQVFVTANRAGFSPNGDGRYDDILFSPIVNLRDGVESWNLALADAAGTARKTYSGANIASLPRELVWDGKDDRGNPAPQGTYTAVFTVVYAKGDAPQARTASFVLDTEGPRVRLRTSPELFSPDNDGVDDELTVAIAIDDASPIETWQFEIFESSVEEGAGPAKVRLFTSWSGTGNPTERILWDGRSNKGELVEGASDYPYAMAVMDAWGNSAKVEGKVTVDVLVIRDGDRLKIKVPSIVFRSNGADFDGLPKEKTDRNEVVLRRIAQILNRFRDYKIRIEGHANSIGKIYGYSAAQVNKEETEELIPLSTNRAEAVRRLLVQFGVDARRLSVRGLGSSEPVVDFKDAENRWKNRRVEFILIRE